MAVTIDLKGKTAIVFGIADEKSIAWHIAKTLDKAGCRIVAAYQERNEKTVLPLMKKLKSPAYAKCDVTSDELLDSFFGKIKSEFGKVDFLIHSIAFAKKEHLKGKYVDIDRKGFLASMEASAYSLTELARRTVPMMNGKGSIVTITYIGSQRAIPNYNVMGVAKAALEASVKYLASDLGKQNIRVNAISAGPVETLAASGIAGFSDIMLDHVAKSPLKRIITAGEVADCALFLCSDLSSAITGQTIYADAGYSIGG
jgi:enoyl-[acyl-carrier protein] reductase I